MPRQTNYIKELLNSNMTLSAKETQDIEDWIHSQTRPVNPSHLNEWKCIAAARGSDGGNL